MHETRRVIYSGHVQGVGFRYTTRAVSRRYDIRGHVKNLKDGTVEVLAQGSPEEIGRFCAALREEMKGFIQDEKAASVADAPAFSTFDIAF